MGEPFVLKFGEFAGKAIEALMFSAKGYDFLRYQNGRILTPENNAFISRVRRLMAKGEAPLLTAKCSCGNAATYVFVRRGNDGVGFGEFCCADCTKNSPYRYEAIELKFSSILRFQGATDRACFIRELKQACGFGATERITAQRAHKFFYPEPSSASSKPSRRGPELPFGG